MPKSKILVQLDTDDQPSVFDAVVAVDAGVEHIFRHAGITAENVRDRVHGAIFTRGPADLKSTAIFIGGSDVTAAEAVLAAVKKSFFGPLSVSVMLDPNGANTTAVAAVLCVARHLKFAESTALVLAATGPVGARVVRLLAREGARVKAASRSADRASAVCDAVRQAVPAANLTPVGVTSLAELTAALTGVSVVVAAGAAGVQLVSEAVRRSASELKVAVDLNAVPPVGLQGVDVMDGGTDRFGVACYGAIGVGGTKMKIHKQAIARLFESNDQILDAEELYALALPSVAS